MVLDNSIDKANINSFIEKALSAYERSTLMNYANLKAKKRLISFMRYEFFPVWKKTILNYLSKTGEIQLKESVLIEHLHESLYADKLFAYEEHRLFQENDPIGYQQYIKDAVSSGFVFYPLE